MALSNKDLYKCHVANLRAIELGISRIERDLRSCLSRGDVQTSEALLKTLLLLTGAWAECRLKKLLYEPAGFNGADRLAISKKGSQIDQWLASLELGYRRRYQVPKAALSIGNLKATAFSRYSLLKEVIESDLRPIIEMRNSLAHGQWARPLNNDETAIANKMIGAMATENAISVRFKQSLLRSLSQLIHDLVSSEDAFERDFDKHFQLISNTKQNLQKRSYESWQESLVARRHRGNDRRRKAERMVLAAVE